MKLIMRADDLGISEGVNCGICKAIKDGVITSDIEMIWSNGNLAGTSLILKDGYLTLQGNSGSAFSNKVMDVNMTGEIVYNYMNYNS